MNSGSPPSSPLLEAVNWLVHLLTGSLGTSLAILVIAWAGIALMQGRLPLRDGARIVLGCFILFGAPLIAKGLLSSMQGSRQVRYSQPVPRPIQTPAHPPQFDPYAGASVPR